ncbi:MAG: M3 family metallopeptidase [Acidimicrobiales bacterium]
MQQRARTEPRQPGPSVSVLTEPWPGPYGGVPPWDRIDPDDFGPAFDEAIAAARREIQAIADNPEPPTVDNTVVALEDAGRALRRLRSMFGVHTSNLNVGPIPALQREIGPKLAAHADWTIQNPRLFARIRAVHGALDDTSDVERSDVERSDVEGTDVDDTNRHDTNGDDTNGLGRPVVDGPTRRLVEDRHRQFVRQGAELAQEEKARLSAINGRLAELYTEFAQNVLHDEANQVTWIEGEAGLDGLPAAVVNSLAAAAADRGRPDAWAVLNTRSSMDPVLTNATDRAVREQVWRNYYSRGDRSGPNDNKPIITEILQLRAERATLLGYESHAHWRLEAAMAKTPAQAMALMMDIWPKARARAVEEVADMQRLADTDADAAGRVPAPIEPWDYRFYAERVRKDRFDLDFNEVKPYLQLEKLIEAMLWCSTELYGLHYTPVEDLDDGPVPVFHPDVRVWRVADRNGELVGLWYLDPFAREGKLSGAWMTAYRSQENLDRPVTTLVSNNSNFIPSGDGTPVLISWDDARTLFHEFGHALHGLLSDVVYPSQSGTSVTSDYVEFPSQINEHWLSTDEVLQRFCIHHETGEPMPAELIERIKRAETFNQGFDTVEYLASALVDMKLHLAGGDPIDPDSFERATLAELGMPPQIVMRHRTPQFAHVFSGEGYAAGYYSYLWADALTADAAEAFEQAGGYFDPEVARRLAEHVFSVGDTVDPVDGFRAFRGRDVDTNALLRKRGFPVA